MTAGAASAQVTADVRPRQRVIENLNAALSATLAADADVYLLGEDIADPYGGAFKATRGLSDLHPGRVISTPISENGVMGVANGLALAGDKAIVEMMFADFVTLAFDQIVNFAAKSVTMYGRRLPMHVVVRCPTGGTRGYGPTHSQSLQKHFIGVPSLSLFEMTPFHDNRDVLATMLGSGAPALFFEDKVLYGAWMCTGGMIGDLFRYDIVGDAPGVARVFVGAADDPADCVLVAPGGMTHRVLDAMRALLLADEIVCQLLVPSRLHPLDTVAISPALARSGRVCVVEESTAGGTWGAEVSQAVQQSVWATLHRPVRVICSADAIIPAAGHLERRMLVRSDTIRAAVRELCRD